MAGFMGWLDVPGLKLFMGEEIADEMPRGKPFETEGLAHVQGCIGGTTRTGRQGSLSGHAGTRGRTFLAEGNGSCDVAEIPHRQGFQR